MTTTRTTCRSLRDIDKAPNLESEVRDDAAWLRLDYMDHGHAIYETTTDPTGAVKSRRVKIDETKP
jgi:hypothetical protein